MCTNFNPPKLTKILIHGKMVLFFSSPPPTHSLTHPLSSALPYTQLSSLCPQLRLQHKSYCKHTFLRHLPVSHTKAPLLLLGTPRAVKALSIPMPSWTDSRTDQTGGNGALWGLQRGSGRRGIPASCCGEHPLGPSAVWSIWRWLSQVSRNQTEKYLVPVMSRGPNMKTCLLAILIPAPISYWCPRTSFFFIIFFSSKPVQLLQEGCWRSCPSGLD